jgi:hypothetical protein
MWFCLFLPWHQLRVIGKPSEDTDHVRCSCGREYGMHHPTKSFVEWDRDIADFHREVNDYQH